MDITNLLNESLQPEQAKLVEQAILDAVQVKINEATQDAARAQAEAAQKYAEQVDSLDAHYKGELRKAASMYAALETHLDKELKIAVDAVVKAYDEKDRLEEHYVGELQEAANRYITETDGEALSEMKQTIADYVTERAELLEQAQKYGEYGYSQGLEEAERLSKEAADKFIAENQEKFEQLDEMARIKSTLNTIKESFEKHGFGLSEDLAYQGLEEEVKSKETEISQLQESLKAAEAKLFESEKEKAFAELTSTLSESQREKLQGVATAITANEISGYRKTLSILVESTNLVKEPVKTKLPEEKTEVNTLTESKFPQSRSMFGDEPNDFVQQIVGQMKKFK